MLNELRTLVQGFLETLHARVYFKNVPKNATFPYIVYDFPNLLADGEGFQNITVDVDGWDKPSDGDDSGIETLMTTINGNGETGLNKKTLTTDNLVVSFFLENKMTLDEEDERIFRRKYVYQARLFERSGA